MKDVECGTPLSTSQVSPSAASVSSSSTSTSTTTILRQGGEKLDLRSWRSWLGTAGGKAVAACAFYSSCSVSMVLVNKSLASSYNHLIVGGDLNILLVVIQAVVAVAAVSACKRMKWVEYPDFDWAVAKQWAPVNIFFCLMLFTGMASLQHNSVPMVTIFKNLTNILTCYGDYKLFGTSVERLVMMAFGVMLGGAVLAAWNDIYITSLGLFWMSLNCISTSGYVLYMKYATKNVKLSKFGMVYYNNLLCVAFLLPVSYAMGQVHLLATTKALHTFDYLTKNVYAGLVGFLLNFASLSCVAATGPTTYAIVGTVNKIPVAFLGYLIFDNIITRDTWFFIAVSMMGGFLYSYAKITGTREKGCK